VRILAALLALLPIGHSVDGRAIRPVVLGDPGAARKVLVVGCIHGTERAGQQVTRRLVRAGAPSGAEIVVVAALNPDGCAAGTRGNAHGVDLNRNFPSLWSRSAVSGPRRASEPETRYAMALIEALRPDVTIWFHQPEAAVRAWGPSVAVARRFAALAAYPYRTVAWPHGSATNWQNHRYPRSAAFVVELPPGRLPAARAAAWVRAIRVLARGASHR
jgi:murein peptide amidase A